MRLIDADALKNRLTALVRGGTNLNYCIADMIDRAITIEPERKKGRWMPLQLSIAYPPYQCSCCFGNAPMVMVGTGRLKKGHLEALLTDFCPDCGAEMKEGDPE